MLVLPGRNKQEEYSDWPEFRRGNIQSNKSLKYSQTSLGELQGTEQVCLIQSSS